MASNIHKSVLANEVIESINIKKDGIYIDMTLGRGGHTELFLKKLDSNGKIIGIDQDEQSIEFCKEKFLNDNRVTIIKNNFCKVREILDILKIKYVDGILMDLGVSSPQLDNPERGFSYQHDGPLDMRMDQSQKISAYDVVNKSSLKELNTIFSKYGEIKKPFNVSQAIIKARSIKPIESTLELVEIIKASIQKTELFKKKHFAKRYFQALRIAVNNELTILEKTIELAAQCLKKDGYLQIISFHSLEDKIVIKKFKQLSKTYLPKEIPMKQNNFQEYKIVNVSAITPDSYEININSRARSARLRILKRIKD